MTFGVARGLDVQLDAMTGYGSHPVHAELFPKPRDRR
jgi:hypothetical protein